MIRAATAAAAAAANDEKSGEKWGATDQQLQVIINDSVDGSFPPPEKQEKLGQPKKRKWKAPVAFFQLISESDLIAVFGCCCCGAPTAGRYTHSRAARCYPLSSGYWEAQNTTKTERSRRGRSAASPRSRRRSDDVFDHPPNVDRR
jgi:hypothetical protein